MGIWRLAAVLIFTSVSLHAKTHKIFPATHDSIPAENRSADMLNLKRYGTLADVAEDVRAGALVPLRTQVSSKLPENRRYALPGTVAFAEKLDSDFYDATEHHLVIDSAVRPRDVQKRLIRRNRNAAPADGARASTHERGTTFDLSRRMRKGEYRWLLIRLGYYKARGEILVIEERSCLHIFVGGEYVDGENILAVRRLDLEHRDETLGRQVEDDRDDSRNDPMVSGLERRSSCLTFTTTERTAISVTAARAAPSEVDNDRVSDNQRRTVD